MRTVNIISAKDSSRLHDKIIELINQNFIKLNIIHKKILIKYLYITVLLFSFYFCNDKFVEQMFMNKYQDIFSLLVLLMPYYELNTSKNIKSLDELFLNSDSKAKSLLSSYYIDHLELKNNTNYLEEYFNSSIYSIAYTLSQIHCLILPNWCNIFPYTMETYKSSNIYKNFINIYKKKNFEISEVTSYDEKNIFNEINERYFLLGYPILYGTIYNFLYLDIKPIKWMIYDLNINKKKIIPNIVYLCNKLEINYILNQPWIKLKDDKKKQIENLWKKFYESNQTNKISIKSLVLFYLRWENDNDNLKDLGFSHKCLKEIKNNLDNLLEEDNFISNDNIIDEKNEVDIYSNNLDLCLEKIYPLIKFENLYNYIYQSLHRFKYTWYGFICLDKYKNILTEDNFYNNYFQINEEVIFDNELKYLNYITPKNIYNFCKSLIHYKVNDNYIPLSNSGKWNNVIIKNKYKFIKRLSYINTEWFNIKKNILRTYGKIDLEDRMNKLIEFFSSKIFFVNIIFQTLVYNGMLSFYKFNPKMTDNNIIPNKDTNYDNWNSYILNTVDINSFTKSFHPFSNSMLDSYNHDIVSCIKNSLWYTNFGANWIAQIQLYHHYLHNRVIFITGATGAGKSTVAPFLLVYAVKILNFNNNARVVCTQPRTQPVKGNAEQISKNIGLPIKIKINRDLDSTDELYKNTTIGEAIIDDINYIQYKHKNGSLVDDLYHPYLRLYTDGSLYNIIKQNYFFKISFDTHTNNIKYLKNNIFDIILVDEAHEHNTYMDMILTLSKYAIYINNQVTLGIISATMESDELIYRKYFESIDDNWKAPLNVSYIDFYHFLNAQFIDRRIHLSIPFGGMNFEVIEFPSYSTNNQTEINKYDAGTFIDLKKINKKIIDIVKYILKNYIHGDILIFQPGESDIKKLVKEINLITPRNVLAIPFYSKLDTEILENIVKKVDKKDIRSTKFRYPKNKYDITEINNIPTTDLLPEGTYNRFIIIATNIAEASITINTLEYVIDVGNQKIAVYDSDTNQNYLEIREIAVPNQKQRKGRVGRIKPGKVFYTYDRRILGEKVIYKINIENINSFVLDLVSSENTKFIDKNSDPYKTNNYQNIPECLQSQYIFTNSTDEYELYNYKFSYKNVTDIIYPYIDGKYKLETLEDEDGKFYLIHPNEDYFERNPETLVIINKNLKLNYINKVKKVFEYGKLNFMIGNDNLLTPFGKLINNFSDFIEIIENSVDFTKIILDCNSFNIPNNSEIFKNILMFIIFKINTFNFKIPKYLVGRADYLIYFSLIKKYFYHVIKFEDIISEFNSDLSNLREIIEKKISFFLYNNKFENKFNLNIEEIKKILISYYTLKTKIDIIYYNNKFLLKDEFTNIYDLLLLQKQKSNNISIEYLNIIDSILLYYTQNKIIEKKILHNFILELEKINESNISKNISLNIISNIKKILDKSSIYKNEYLSKINLYSNIKYSEKLNLDFNNLTDYEKLCFIIIKNFPQNILIKIPFSKFYIEYYKKDINRIYMLEEINIKLSETKIINFTKTKVYKDIRNYFIFAVNINDNYDLESIFVLSENIINILNNYFISSNINLFKKNIIFNKELCLGLYQEDKFNYVIKKIYKIIDYLNN